MKKIYCLIVILLIAAGVFLLFNNRTNTPVNEDKVNMESGAFYFSPNKIQAKLTS